MGEQKWLYLPKRLNFFVLKAAIIGSGIAGIACSIRLAMQGFEVDVYEANSTPGGKITSFRKDGFRFDKGPSLFTMPELVEELFELAQRDPRTYFHYKSLAIACQYFYEDKTTLTAYTNVHQFSQEVMHKLGIKAKIIENYLARSNKLFELTKTTFLEHSLHQWGTYCTKNTLKLLYHILELPLLRSFHQSNTIQLKHPKLIQLFNRFATYQGANPYTASGILQVIPHLEHNIGAFFPQGGMYTIVQSLFKLSQELGVRYYFNTPVEKIWVSQRKTYGICIGQEKIPAAVVISNVDVMTTYRRFLPHIQLPKQISQQKRSSSALIFYWGINAVFPELSLHNIFFSARYQKEFEAIFKHRCIIEDPTIYIHISAKENPADTPESQENWFVMINVPANQGQDWHKLIAKAKTILLKKLTRIRNKPIEPLIE